ncbi:NADH:ubiquinone oxidoreductase subunit 5 [Longilinea arvoryzae]|uniref:NADH:ubiquinone oxidoreductase subunit 5 n=1 Tax=Longilinea arvoryzae TaxID=360412 RepID=A0A0S7B9X2_9CHLR|nr:NADH-quinone oxidoreductase subunit L [Longilinea arvoryzae]GAP14348.1 NADH:ubiquinone oxidoreductase subunit 5 [Longilinea arvoryzae]
METNAVLIPIGALFAGVLILLVANKALSTRAKGWLAFICGLVAMAGTLSLLPQVIQNGAVDLSLFDWDGSISFAYHVDGLSMVFALMASVIGTAILLYCIPYMAHEEGTTRFYALMLTFIAGLINLVFSANLLVAYVSWEIIGLCSYFLVGFWYKQTAAAQGARKVLIMTHIAGYGFLIGILLLAARSGSFMWTDPAVGASFSTGIFLLMLVAAMAKSVLFPINTWIPEAMNAPTPVSALLHSACYVKAGVYLIARMYSLQNPWGAGWNTLVLVISALTMLIGALFALKQTDLKRLLAYSTISQIGHIITALALGTPLGVAAGIFYVINHGLFKGTLFLVAGAVQHETGTRDMRKLGGLFSRMPATTIIWLIAAGAIVGVPLGNGFVAKWLLLDSALDAGSYVIVLVTWLTSVLTAFYMLKATVSTFFGQLPQDLEKKGVHDAAPAMRIGMGVLAGLCILFGVAPQILIGSVVVPAVKSLGFENVLQLSWLGLHTGTAGISVTLGAVVVLVAIVLGGLIFWISKPRPNATANVFTGGDPLVSPDEAVSSTDFTELVEEAVEPVYKVTDPDPVYLAIWSGIKAAAGWLDRIARKAGEERPLLAALALAVVVAAVIWLGA